MTPARIRIGAIVGVVGFALVGIVLAIIAAFVAFAGSGVGCPGCTTTARGDSHAVYYLVGAGACVIGALVCAVFIRNRES